MVPIHCENYKKKNYETSSQILQRLRALPSLTLISELTTQTWQQMKEERVKVAPRIKVTTVPDVLKVLIKETKDGENN